MKTFAMLAAVVAASLAAGCSGDVGYRREDASLAKARGAWDVRAVKASKSAQKAWEGAKKIDRSGHDAQVIEAVASLKSLNFALEQPADSQTKALLGAAIEHNIKGTGSLVGSVSPGAEMLADDLGKLAGALKDRPLVAQAVGNLEAAARSVTQPVETRKAQALEAVAGLADATRAAAPTSPNDGSNLSKRVGNAERLIDNLERDVAKLPKEARESLETLKNDAVDAVVGEFESLQGDIDEMVKKGDFQEAMGSALGAAKAASRLAGDLSRWGDMNDLQKIQSVLSNLAGIMEAAQPFVTAAVGEFKLPIMVALMVLADLIDFGGGGDGGDDHKQDGAKDDKGSSSKDEANKKQSEPGKGGSGPGQDQSQEGEPSEDAKQNAEKQAGDAVKQAFDNLKNGSASSPVTPGSLAGSVADKLGFSKEQNSQLAAKYRAEMAKRMGADGKISDAEGLYKSLVSVTAEVGRAGSQTHSGSEDDKSKNPH